MAYKESLMQGVAVEYSIANGDVTIDRSGEVPKVTLSPDLKSKVAKTLSNTVLGKMIEASEHERALLKGPWMIMGSYFYLLVRLGWMLVDRRKQYSRKTSGNSGKENQRFKIFCSRGGLENLENIEITENPPNKDVINGHQSSRTTPIMAKIVTPSFVAMTHDQQLGRPPDNTCI
ncbi:hypothetical protein ACFE04_012809 [Oxalis oulophora]